MSNKEWYKVDNVAKVFLSSMTKRDTRTLRVSCTLKEKVDPAILQKALLITIKSRPNFQVRIRRGLFWHYIEETDIMPVVKKESERPCPCLYGPDHHGFLHYQVTYYHKRINFEVFHALSDGTGALEFLNILVFNYLKIANPDELGDMSVGGRSSEHERAQDSFEHFYEETDEIFGVVPKKVEKAYSIQGRLLPYDQVQFFEIHMNGSKVLQNAKQIQVSVTSYLSALIMMAIEMDMPARLSSKPVVISIPVNLRNYFKSDTLRNFFNNVNVGHVFTGDETIEELAREFDEKLKAELTPEKIREQMNDFARLEHILFARLAPLFIKNPVIKMFTVARNKGVSAVVSNLGRMGDLPPEVAKHVGGYSAYCSYDGLFTTISSYGDEMVMGVSSVFSNTSVLRNFVQLLRQEEIQVKIYASEVVK